MIEPNQLRLFVRHCALLACIAIFGCAGNSKQSRTAAQEQSDARQIQSQLMAFANRYIIQITEILNQVQRDTKSPELQLVVVRAKLIAADSAIGHAVEINPLVGLMDMADMVTINQMISGEPWLGETFGPEAASQIAAALKSQEHDIWTIAAQYLTSDQMTELRKLCAQWLADHPNEHYAASVRLADFPQAKQSNIPGQQLASSVFGLLTLDPFNGLDPAVQEVEQSRVLAERMFFYLRHAPMLLTWQAEALYLQMLAAPQIAQALADTGTVAGSTTRFTDSTQKFADVSGQFAKTIEEFRVNLPKQQATLVDQLNNLVATQRSAALTQATTQISAQQDLAARNLQTLTDASIKQLNTTVAAQQKELTQNLQTVMDKSIDRLYERVRTIVLIAAGSILLALLIYRAIAGTLFGKKPAR